MSQKFFNSVQTAIFYDFLKIGKMALFQNTTESQSHWKGSGYSETCDVIPGHWSLSCLEPRLLRFGRSEILKMPDKCVVFGCNNKPSKAEGISLHPIPFEGADEPQKRKRRKQWVDFVKSKRAHWEPTKYSAVCSKHFREEDYEVMFPGLTNVNMQRRLRKDEIGICVCPTIQAPGWQCRSPKLRRIRLTHNSNSIHWCFANIQGCICHNDT